MQERALAHHLLTQHNDFQRPAKRQRVLEMMNRAPITYRVSIPVNGIQFDCPVPGCTGRASTRSSLRTHFSFRHPTDVIVVEEEGPLPRCMACMLFTSTANTPAHLRTQICQRGSVRKRRRELDYDYLTGMEAEFSISGTVIEPVDCFRYLGRPINATGSDWSAVVYNLRKARGRWARVTRVLSRQGASSKISGYFYKAVCQSVLLYGCETWLVNQPLLRCLEGFHHHVARKLSHRSIRPDPMTGVWHYPAVATVLEAASLRPLSEYVLRRRRYLQNWAQNRTSYQQCVQMTQGVGGPRRHYWWSNTDQ